MEQLIRKKFKIEGELTSLTFGKKMHVTLIREN